MEVSGQHHTLATLSPVQNLICIELEPGWFPRTNLYILEKKALVTIGI